MHRLVEILSQLKRIAIVCNQWGDTGKGKLVDLAIHIYLLELKRGVVYCIRGMGGPNAGHTVVVGGLSVILHEIPSGVLHDAEGCISVIGPGVVVDPRITVVELEELAKLGLIVQHLAISHEAPVITPQHIFADRYSVHSQRIGTTGRGIGPAYGDVVARHQIFVNDLLNPRVLEEKLRAQNARLLTSLGGTFDREQAARILANPYFGEVSFFDPDTIFDVDKVLAAYLGWADRLAPFITDVGAVVQGILARDETAVLEGAQGLLLGVRHGTTMFQTSSDASAAGLILGAGFQSEDIDRVFGIAKAPCMTRVGGGPFPTEMGGAQSEAHCADSTHTRQWEAEHFFALQSLVKGVALGLVDWDGVTDFNLGVVVRQKGGEYGATTGRPRRTGWLDLVALRYAVQVNGQHLVLTKFDVMSNIPLIRLCVGYRYRGLPVNYAGRVLNPGDEVKDFIRFSEILEYCEPVYLDMPGWNQDISLCRDYDELPIECRNIVDVIERESGGQVVMISVGADRDATITR